jgi:hypothetical protein
MLSGNSTDQPEQAEAPVDPQAMVDAMLSPDSFDEPPPVVADEAAPEVVEPAPEEENSKPAKKPAKGKKAKA